MGVILIHLGVTTIEAFVRETNACLDTFFSYAHVALRAGSLQFLVFSDMKAFFLSGPVSITE